jgi:hypothetical protein
MACYTTIMFCYHFRDFPTLKKYIHKYFTSLFFFLQVSIFVLVGLILAGAVLGYWIVRKFVISKDGSVDVGIAHFVKWAMRIIGTTFILQVLYKLHVGDILEIEYIALFHVEYCTLCFIYSFKYENY